MRRLQPALCLAQEMGARLGEREVLLRALSRCAAPIRLRAEIGAAMSVLRIIFGDQLSFDLTALAALAPGRDVYLKFEAPDNIGSFTAEVQTRSRGITRATLRATRHYREDA